MFLRLVFVILLHSTLYSQSSTDVLKTVILDRINQFITYDATPTNEDFIICIYKNKVLYKTALQAYKNRKYKNRNIEVTYTKDLSSVSQCNVFYADELSKHNQNQLIKMNKTKTLLVTSNDAYLENGFMVSLFLKNQKINFGINQDAIVKAGLKVNYRLLKVASRVISVKKK